LNTQVMIHLYARLAYTYTIYFKWYKPHLKAIWIVKYIHMFYFYYVNVFYNKWMNLTSCVLGPNNIFIYN
jgi:hypothetical protein